MATKNRAAQQPKHTRIEFKRTAGLVPDGVHRFFLKDFDELDGPSGFPYWLYTAECAENGPFDGTRVFVKVSTSPAARWKMEEFLEAVAAPEDGAGTGEKFVGKYLRIKLTSEEYDGKMRNVADSFLPDKAVKGKKSAIHHPTSKKSSRVVDEEEEDIEEEDVDEEEDIEEEAEEEEDEDYEEEDTDTDEDEDDVDEEEEDEDEDYEEEDDEEDEEDDEDYEPEPPKSKVKAPAKKAPPAKKPAPARKAAPAKKAPVKTKSTTAKAPAGKFKKPFGRK